MSSNQYTNQDDVDTNIQNHEVHHVPGEGATTQTLEPKGARHHVIEQLYPAEGVTGSRQMVAVTFPFRGATGTRGKTKIGVSAALTLVSLFLLSEIHAMPTLTTKIYLLSGAGLIAAVVICGLGLRDMFGSLTINSDGISVTPSIMGFTVPWTSLRSWTVRVDSAGGPALTLKLYDELPRQIPAGLLSEKQLSDIWQVLRAQAMSKEAG